MTRPETFFQLSWLVALAVLGELRVGEWMGKTYFRIEYNRRGAEQGWPETSTEGINSLLRTMHNRKLIEYKTAGAGFEGTARATAYGLQRLEAARVLLDAAA